jgi:hypothetical protein
MAMTPNKKIQKVILKTLAYARIFNCDLTKKELFHLAISEFKFSKIDFEVQLMGLVKQKRVGEQVIGYDIVRYRPIIKLGIGVENISRDTISRNKLNKTRTWKKWLYLIPWIEAVLITGSIGANNPKPGDDIDIFIITKTNRLWLTRFLTIIILQILRVRRKPERDWRGQKNKNIFEHKDLVCTNIYLESNNLGFWAKVKNIYLARELVQIKVLFDKNQILPHLWQKNLWVKKYVPHSPFLELNFDNLSSKAENQTVKVLNLLNRVSFYLQTKYMKSKITNEQVGYNYALFHPQNSNQKVLKKFQINLNNLL